MAKRGTLSTKIPAADLTQALYQAASTMQSLNRRVMTAEILLHTFLKMPDTAAHQILRRLANQRGINWKSFEEKVARAAADRMTVDVNFDFETDGNQRVPLGDDILYLIDEGYTLAQARNEMRCGTEHVLAMMPERRVSVSRLLTDAGITVSAVMDLLPDPTLSPHAATRDHVALAKNGRMAPVYFRDKLLNELVSLLSMAHNRHTILVGATGVGKRAMVYSLAQLIADGKGPVGLKSVIEMDEQALLDNSLKTVRGGLRQAQGGILFVPNIARFFGGFRAEFPEKAGVELQKAFFGNDVVIIGTATPGRFDDRLAGNATIVQNSTRFTIPPTDEAETTEVLRALIPRFQTDYQLKIAPESLPEVSRLAKRYLTENPLPGAAVHLLHRACALLNMSAHGQPVDNIPADRTLNPEDVMVAVSMLTGIPVSSMGADERNRYAQMVEHLHKRIIGQNEAVLALSRAVKMARVGLKDPKRPIGSFLFLGPTGVGKSELAKALAEFMFGTEDALITLDMSEYMDESSVNRLIGSPPGYVGYSSGGQLTDAVKARPYSVVLFDEVEKAALKVFDLLLQIMDEGRLTSGKGETVSFRETVILMTSNIGGKFLANPELSETAARAETDRALKEHFRPEFLNRLDDIIYFHSLSAEDLRQILDLMLKKELKRLAAQNISLEITTAAKTWLLAQNDHPEWGARPLRRLIQEYIRSPMADFLLENNPQAGVTLRVDAGDSGLKFSAK